MSKILKPALFIIGVITYLLFSELRIHLVVAAFFAICIYKLLDVTLTLVLDLVVGHYVKKSLKNKTSEELHALTNSNTSKTENLELASMSQEIVMIYDDCKWPKWIKLSNQDVYVFSDIYKIETIMAGPTLNPDSSTLTFPSGVMYTLECNK